MIKVKFCDCKNEFQDKTYGKGKRAMNLTEKKGSNKIYRCTVCKKER